MSGSHQPHLACQRFRLAHPGHRHLLARLQLQDEPLGHIGPQLQLAVADQREHRVARRCGDCTHHRVALHDLAAHRRDHVGARQLQLQVLDLRVDQRQLRLRRLKRLLRHRDARRCCRGLRLGCIRRRLRRRSLRPQRLRARAHALRLIVVGARFQKLRLCLRNGRHRRSALRRELAFLQLQRRIREPGQNLALLHAVADLDHQRLDGLALDQRLHQHPLYRRDQP